MLGAQVGSAVELKEETIQAFDHYTAELEAKLTPRWHGTYFPDLGRSVTDRNRWSCESVPKSPPRVS